MNPSDIGSSSDVAESKVSSRRLAREELDRELREVPSSEAESGMGAMLFRTFLVLGIVVLAIYLTLNFGLRRMMGLKAPAGKGAGLITVLERVALDQRRALFVIKAANEYLLVGGGEAHLNLICKLSTEEVDQLRAQPVSPQVMSPFLEKLLSRKNPPS
ncbi:MAG: FliO/MopB family protein [Myxococcaceae bacterium]